jgi:FkbM family methyltransferase
MMPMRQAGGVHPFAIWFSAQRWLPYKTRRSVLKKIAPSMLAGHDFEVDFYGGLGLRFSGNIINYIDRLVYFCGAHEKYMLHFMADYVAALKRLGHTGPLTYMDVGANAGNHVLFMSRHVDRVLAFEPFERVRRQLLHNLELNRIHHVAVFDFGLANDNALKPFYAAPESNLGAASFQPGHKADNRYLGDMRLCIGDEVLAREQAKVDIVKVDVEGYEKYVLEGLRQSLRRDRPLVIMEMTETTRRTLGSDAALAALVPERYRLYYFSRGSNDSGAYRLAPYDMSLKPKIEDVIACPEERLTALGKI